MPVRRLNPQPDDSHPELVEELARVMREDKPEGPPDEPEVQIEKIRFSDNLHVTVIWDKWKDVGLEERGRMILAAMGEAWGEQEMLRVTLAMGLTRAEYQRRVKEAFARE